MEYSTVDAICDTGWICTILLLLALLGLLLHLLLLLLIYLPLLCESFLVLDGSKNIVSFGVFWIVWANSIIFHLLELLIDVSERCFVRSCGTMEVNVTLVGGSKAYLINLL